MKVRTSRASLRTLAGTVWMVLMLGGFTVGCGGSTTAHVSGKVFLADGKPLPGGTVVFYPTTGGKMVPTNAQIQEDGSYDMPKAPVGPVKITVSNSELKSDMPPPVGQGGGMPSGPGKGPMAGKMNAAAKGQKMEANDEKARAPQWTPPPKPPGTYVQIPNRFANLETSGLSYDVKPGEQKYDIKLSE